MPGTPISSSASRAVSAPASAETVERADVQRQKKSNRRSNQLLRAANTPTPAPSQQSASKGKVTADNQPRPIPSKSRYDGDQARLDREFLRHLEAADTRSFGPQQRAQHSMFLLLIKAKCANWQRLADQREHNKNQMLEITLQSFKNDIASARAKFPLATFPDLTEAQVKKLSAYVDKHFDDNDFGHHSEAHPALNRINFFVTRFPLGPEGTSMLAKWGDVQHKLGALDGDNEMSLQELLAYHDIPYLSVTPESAPQPIVQPVQRPTQVEVAAVTQVTKNPLKTPVAPVECVEPIASTSMPKESLKIGYGPEFIRQVQRGLPPSCKNSLTKIIEDIRGERLGNHFWEDHHLYHVNMGDGSGKGAWRLLVKKLDSATGPIHQISGIMDYHGKLELWGGGKLETVLRPTLHDDPFRAFRSLHIVADGHPDDTGVYTIDGRSYVPLVDQGPALFQVVKNAGHLQLFEEGSSAWRNPILVKRMEGANGSFAAYKMGLHGGGRSDPLSSSTDANRAALAQMRESGRWNTAMGDLMPMALARKVGRDILIWNQRTGTSTVFSGTEGRPGHTSAKHQPPKAGQLHLLRVNDNHYDAVVAGKRVPIPGDGNCLFASVSHALQQHGENRSAIQLRADAVDYLQGHPDVLADYHEAPTEYLEPHLVFKRDAPSGAMGLSRQAVIKAGNARYQTLRDRYDPQLNGQTATTFDTHDQPLPSAHDEQLYAPHPLHSMQRLQPASPRKEGNLSLREALQLSKTVNHQAQAADALAEHHREDFERFTLQRKRSLLTGQLLPDESPAASARLLAPALLQLLGDAQWPTGRAYVLLDNQQRCTRFTRVAEQAQDIGGQTVPMAYRIERQIVAEPNPGDVVIRLPERLNSAPSQQSVVVVRHEAELPWERKAPASREYGPYAVGVYSPPKPVRWYPIPVSPPDAEGLHTGDELLPAVAAGALLADGALAPKADLHAKGSVWSGWGLGRKLSTQHDRWAAQVRRSAEQLGEAIYPRLNASLGDGALDATLYASYRQDALYYRHADAFWHVLKAEFDSGLSRLYGFDTAYTDMLNGLADQPHLLVKLLTEDSSNLRSFNQQLTYQLRINATRHVTGGRELVDPMMERFVERHLHTLNALHRAGYSEAVRASLAGKGSLASLVAELPPSSRLHTALRALYEGPHENQDAEPLSALIGTVANAPVLTEEMAMLRYQIERPADPRRSAYWQQKWSEALRNNAGPDLEVVKARFDLENLRIAEIYDTPGSVSPSALEEANRKVEKLRQSAEAAQAASQAQSQQLASLLAGNGPGRGGAPSITSVAVGKSTVVAAPPHTTMSASFVAPKAPAQQQPKVAASSSGQPSSLQRSQTLLALDERGAQWEIQTLLGSSGAAEYRGLEVKMPEASVDQPQQAPAEVFEQVVTKALVQNPSPRALHSLPSLHELDSQSPLQAQPVQPQPGMTAQLSSHPSLPVVPTFSEAPTKHEFFSAQRASSLSSVPSNSGLELTSRHAGTPVPMLPAGVRSFGSRTELEVQLTHGPYDRELAILSFQTPRLNDTPTLVPERSRQSLSSQLASHPNTRNSLRAVASPPELLTVDRGPTGVGVTLGKYGEEMDFYLPASPQRPLKLRLSRYPEFGHIDLHAILPPLPEE